MLKQSFIPSPCVQNHAANLLALPNGDVLCVWFGGTQEGMADISIYGSRLTGGVWSEAVKLSDDPTRSEQNPVLFLAPDGRLWLMWTAQVSGNQDTAFVRKRISTDQGKTWGPIEAMIAPKPTGGTFIRQPIMVLDNGDWLLPTFNCPVVPGQKWVGSDDTSTVKLSTDQGATWQDIDVPDSTGCVHMNIVKGADKTLLAFYRSRWADNIYQNQSLDNGRTWSKPVASGLPNNNSSIQCTRLANGHLALVFNNVRADATTSRRVSLYDEIDDGDGKVEVKQQAGKREAFWGTPRAPMTIAITTDNGKSWTLRDIETGDGYCMTNNSRDKSNRELSYPSVMQAADGAIHVAYTHHRRAIKHVRLSEEWITHDKD